MSFNAAEFTIQSFSLTKFFEYEIWSQLINHMFTCGRYEAAELLIKSLFYSYDIVKENEPKCRLMTAAVPRDQLKCFYIKVQSHLKELLCVCWQNNKYNLKTVSLRLWKSKHSGILFTFSVTNENCFFLVVTKMSVDELHQLNGQLLMQIQSEWLFFFTAIWGQVVQHSRLNEGLVQSGESLENVFREKHLNS